MNTTPHSDDFVRAQESRFTFNTWRDRNRLGAGLFIAGYRPARVQAADWKLLREQSFAIPGRAIWTQLMYTRADGQAVQVETYECQSLEAAHGMALEILGNYQTQLKRDEIEGVGDVMFRTDTSASIVFCRGNIVVVLTAASPASATPAVLVAGPSPLARRATVESVEVAARAEAIDIKEFALCIDADLIRKPEAAPETSVEGAGVLRMQAVKSMLSAADSEAVATAEVARDKQQTIRVWATGGEIVQMENGLMVRPTGSGSAKVQAFLEDVDGRLEPMAELRVEVEE